MALKPRYIKYIFYSALPVLLCISWYSYYSIRQYVKNAKWIEHTYIIITKLDQILYTLREVESAQRGFLLTNKQEFLKPFLHSYPVVDSLFKDLKNETKDNADQQKKLDSLRVLIQNRYSIFHKAINLLSSETLVTTLNRGKATMDSIQDLKLRMENIERDLLSERIKEADFSQMRIFITVGIFTLIAFLAIYLSFDKIFHELKAKYFIQRELERKNKELNLSNTELQQFASIASHDLKEPLRKINMFSDMLSTEHKESLNEEGRDYLFRIVDAGTRMQILIEELLTFSRVGAKKEPFKPTDLNVIFQEILSDLEATITEKSAEIHTDRFPVIDAIPTQMRQLFQNLISNALKFTMKDKRPIITIKLEADKDEKDFCKIIVTDNGVGFDEKYLDRIFVIFQRLFSRDEFEGTGIGLAICKKIVDYHGGSITAKSEINHGASFIVTLPVKQEFSSGQH